MTDKRLRRKCRCCGKRVNLIIVEIGNLLYVKCPNCLKQARYFNQRKYEERKRR
jgi:endogenous inhibitor of DNA gyrase (YacG/DUF329 family)